MQTLQQSIPAGYTSEKAKTSLVSRFLNWCEAQEESRFGWLAVMIFVHGCVLTPITILAVVSSGNSMVAWGFAMAAMAMTLISNLAAAPTKYTVPIFFLSLLIDSSVIITCVTIMLRG